MPPMTVRRAVVVFPSEADTVAVERFRVGWDPLAAQIAAHITLVFPFETNADPAVLEAAVKDVAAGHHRFAVDLADPSIHDGEYLFLLASQGAEQIRRLHTDLYDALNDAHLAAPFVPHMTIGRQPRRADIAKASRAARRLNLRVRGTVRELTLYRIENGSSRHVELAAALATHNDHHAAVPPSR
jgi:2'-5' RNA ligase